MRGYKEQFELGNNTPSPYMELHTKNDPRSGTPMWVKLLQKSFNWSLSYSKTSLSALLFIKKTYENKDRVFLVSFGSGHASISTDYLEHFFGLKVSLNMIDERGLKELDSRRIDHNTRNKKTQMSNEAKIEEFEYEENQDWLFYAYGKVKATYKDISTTVSGRTQLSINAPDNISDLDSILDKLLKIFLTDMTYKKNFPYLDALEAVHKKSSIYSDLNDRLKKNIQTKQNSFFAIAYPEFFQDQPQSFKIYFDREYEVHDNLTPSTVRNFASKISLDNVFKIKVQGGEELIEKGAKKFNPSTPMYSIGEFIVSEEKIGTSIYVYTWGKWYKIDNDFRKNLVASLKTKVKDFTSVLNLPKYKKYANPKKNGAEEYNEAKWNSEVFASNTDYKLMDRNNIYYPKNQKAEPCDALSKDNKYIAVKRMKDSATMSHLFSQGYVSATLLRSDDKFKRSISKLKKATWQGNQDILTPNPCFIFAIPSSGSGDILDKLFFFSQITLDRTARDIGMRGFDVGVCKIDI